MIQKLQERTLKKKTFFCLTFSSIAMLVLATSSRVATNTLSKKKLSHLEIKVDEEEPPLITALSAPTMLTTQLYLTAERLKRFLFFISIAVSSLPRALWCTETSTG